MPEQDEHLQHTADGRGYYIGYRDNYVTFINDGGRCVAKLDNPNKHLDDANRIIHRVNLPDRLVGGLKKAKIALGELHDPGCEVYELVSTLLAECKGGA